MPLQECMERHTIRQYKVWMAWLGEQWNKPSRSDYYLMQIAAEIHFVLRKGKLILEKFKLPFGSGAKSEQPKQTKERVTKQAKSQWFGFLRMKDKQ